MNFNPATAPAALMLEVLRPTPAKAIRSVKPVQPEPGSFVERIVNHAARKVRDAYLAGRRAVNYDSDRPEYFFDACFDTWMTAAELSEAIPDDTELALAEAVFERAGWSDRLRPTTLRAQVEMQVIATEAARKARVFMMRQQSLALGA